MDIECVIIVLVLISSVSAYKTLKCRIKCVLARFVNKEKFFVIIYKHIFSDIGYAGYVATYILANPRVIYLGSSMSDNFLPSSPIFSSDCPVMIALNPKSKVAFGYDHWVINLLILIKPFQISDIAPNITQADAGDKVGKIGTPNH